MLWFASCCSYFQVRTFQRTRQSKAGKSFFSKRLLRSSKRKKALIVASRQTGVEIKGQTLTLVLIITRAWLPVAHVKERYTGVF